MGPHPVERGWVPTQDIDHDIGIDKQHS
jgi:hypothetical protein